MEQPIWQHDKGYVNYVISNVYFTPYLYRRIPIHVIQIPEYNPLLTTQW